MGQRNNMENIPIHKHNGSDSNQLEAKEALVGCPQKVIIKPTGGTVVDIQARTAINDLIDKLKTVGITL